MLDRQSILLLTVHGLFAVANALSGTFVNVYLWKVKSDFSMIGWFVLTQQLVNGLAFWMIAKWVKEYNKMNCLRIGVVLSALFYLIVLFLGPLSVKMIWLIGTVQGLSLAFFWLSFNVVYFEVTGPDTRDRFNGWSGLLGSLAGMTAPWISGILITRMKHPVGYRLIFTLSLIIFVIAAVISFFLKKRPPQGRFEWLYAFRSLKHAEDPWRRLFPALIAQGIREGVFMFLVGLMVYLATKNELKLGYYTLITSAISLVSYYIVGNWIKPAVRSQAMLVGALSITAAIIPFFVSINYTTLLIFGIVVSLLYPLYVIPITSVAFDAIGRTEHSAEHRVEYVIFRETGLNIGRIAGTAMFLVVVSTTASTQALTWFMMIIGAAPIFSWMFMQKMLGKSLIPTN